MIGEARQKSAGQNRRGKNRIVLLLAGRHAHCIVARRLPTMGAGNNPKFGERQVLWSSLSGLMERGLMARPQ
jgi:hypothetical protein